HSNVVDFDTHDIRIARRQTENAHTAHLELSRAAHLLHMAVTLAELVRVGAAFGAHHDVVSGRRQPRYGRLWRIDEHGGVPTPQSQAGQAVVRDFHAGWMLSHRRAAQAESCAGHELEPELPT